MLQYRAATFLIRTTAPEISMGLQTVEEIEDVPDTWTDAKPVDDVFSQGRHKLPSKRKKTDQEIIDESRSTERKTWKTDDNSDEYVASLKKLSLLWDTKEEEITDTFLSLGVSYNAPDLKQDENDPEVRRIAIEVARRFK